nr:arylacetamide deacetylase-like [Loxodonta africana]
MGKKTLLLLTVGVLLAYYAYIPLPDNLEEPWRLMWTATYIKTVKNLAIFAELLGITNLMDAAKFLISLQEVPPISDENVTVTEMTFNNIPVRVYVPKRKSEKPRRGLFYIHGGGWCFGSAGMFFLLKNFPLIEKCNFSYKKHFIKISFLT